MRKKTKKMALIMSALLLLAMFPASAYGMAIELSLDGKTPGFMQVIVYDREMYVRYAYDDKYDLITLWELRYDSQTRNNNSRPTRTYKALKTSSLGNAITSENEIQSWQDSENPRSIESG